MKKEEKDPIQLIDLVSYEAEPYFVMILRVDGVKRRFSCSPTVFYSFSLINKKRARSEYFVLNIEPNELTLKNSRKPKRG